MGLPYWFIQRHISSFTFQGSFPFLDVQRTDILMHQLLKSINLFFQQYLHWSNKWKVWKILTRQLRYSFVYYALSLVGVRKMFRFYSNFATWHFSYLFALLGYYIFMCSISMMQVQQQVIEVITYIASTAKKFPKKCIVLCLSGG